MHCRPLQLVPLQLEPQQRETQPQERDRRLLPLRLAA